jgi:4-alpha-glucanotransferase
MLRLAYQLARLYGVQTVYHDVFHRRCQASAEAIMAILRSLGAPVATLQDIPSAWREQQQARWQRLLEPVIVAWDGQPSPVRLRLPSATAEATLVSDLTLENGKQERGEWRGRDLPTLVTMEVGGTNYVVKQLPLSCRLPRGYHRLAIELTGKREEALIIAAPLETYVPSKSRAWGVFLPLYALHTKQSWGSGDFSDLESLMSWLAEMGGKVVATLPLLPALLDETPDPSPYLPVSRLMWNEFYLDITRVPELQRCPSAQLILASSSFRGEIESLRQLPLVDYRRQMALKRQVLEELCRCLFAQPSDRLNALQRFAQDHPEVENYARFRATWEKQNTSWPSWQQPLRDGVLKEGDWDEEVRHYHLYSQWLAHEQVKALQKEAGKKGLQLYLDLPLGVHPDGYDVWHHHNLFALDASAGAPPDAVFIRGQDWGFPPLHPEGIREQGYKYVIAYLRHHLEHGGILRIDHVMGLHRLFWIPNGLESSDGVYVRYHADELYAILALESHRYQTILVGEDLGTVPPEVRPAMRRHGLHRMYVAQYETVTNHRRALRPVPANSVASLNTHDMPPFAAFWSGLDIKERVNMGLLDEAAAQNMTRDHQAIREALTTFLHDRGWTKEAGVDTGAFLRACLSFLSASHARVVLVNLEDLWLETRPQNIPSTTEEYPNWRRKARYSFEEFCQMPQVIDTLRIIDQLRRQGRHHDREKA